MRISCVFVFTLAFSVSVISSLKLRSVSVSVKIKQLIDNIITENNKRYIYLFQAILVRREFPELNIANYIIGCSRLDPNLNECGRKNANDAIPELVKGDKKYRIPNLNPLVIPEILIDSNGQLRIQLKNVHVYGLEKAVVTKMNLDLKNQILGASVSIPHLKIEGDYDIKGRILVLPINGNGPANITAVNGLYTMQFKYSLYDKKGVQYGRIFDDRIEYEIKRAYFNLHNLFGNKQLSDQMNQILDDNWNDVLKDLGPAITTAVSAIVKQIFTAVLDHVPYDEIFLP